MSVTIFRWKAGSGGDTVMKLILLSNPSILSQIKYVDRNSKQRSHLDTEFSQKFEYDQITKMANPDYLDVDPTLLAQQLDNLEHSDRSQDWLLKSHCYNIKYKQKIIDIVVSPYWLPFVIAANLFKNARQLGIMADYHVMTSKIADPVVLHKFDLFNSAKNLLEDTPTSNQQLMIDDILNGWPALSAALSNLNIFISAEYQSIYDTWLDCNKCFMPSKLYQSMILDNNLDYKNSELSIAERYCLLALAGQKFKLLV